MYKRQRQRSIFPLVHDWQCAQTSGSDLPRTKRQRAFRAALEEWRATKPLPDSVHGSEQQPLPRLRRRLEANAPLANGLEQGESAAAHQMALAGGEQDIAGFTFDGQPDPCLLYTSRCV